MSRRAVYPQGTGWLHVPLPRDLYERLLAEAHGSARDAGRLAGQRLAEELSRPQINLQIDGGALAAAVCAGANRDS